MIVERDRPFLGILLALIVGFESAALLERCLYLNAFSSFLFKNPETLASQSIEPLSAGLLILLLYLWLIRFVTRGLRTRIPILGRFLAWIEKPLSSMSRASSQVWETLNPLLSKPRLLFGIAVIGGSLIATVPYRGDVNPLGIPVGLDTSNYLRLISDMLTKTAPEALTFAFTESTYQGSRPLLLIAAYALALLGGADFVVKFLPVALTVLLAVSTYLFVLVGLGQRRTAAVAGAFSAFSYQLTVGMWAGYYANWLALSESFALLTSFVAYSRNHSARSLVATIFFSLALLFTHPWTWFVMILLMVFFAMDKALRAREFRLVKPSIVIVVANIGAEIGRTLLVGRSVGNTSFAVVSGHITLQPWALWSNIVASLRYYDGSMSNSIAFGLGFLCLWHLYAKKDDFSRLLVLWVALGSLAMPFLDGLLQTRIVYLLPVSVLVAGGAIGLQQTTRGRAQKAMVLLSLILIQVNYVLRFAVQL